MARVAVGIDHQCEVAATSSQTLKVVPQHLVVSRSSLESEESNMTEYTASRFASTLSFPPCPCFPPAAACAPSDTHILSFTPLCSSLRSPPLLCSLPPLATLLRYLPRYSGRPLALHTIIST